MSRVVRLVGYLALTLTPAALLLRTLLDPSAAPLLGLESGVVLVGAVAIVHEAGGLLPAADRRSLDRPAFDRRDLADVAAVTAGALFTHWLGVHLGLGAVLAAALVGLVAGLAAPSVDASAYCGAFVGMASPVLFPSAGYLAGAALVAGLGYVAARRVFAGVGGKLGTLALFGCATTVLVTDATFAAGTPLAPATAALVVPTTVVGAVAAAALSHRADLGTVVGSALVGVVAGVALPALVPTVGSTLATAAFCASFVGMSGRDRFRTDREVAVAGALCGGVFVTVATTFAGAGGKLGTVAFISCVTVLGAEAALGREWPQSLPV